MNVQDPVVAFGVILSFRPLISPLDHELLSQCVAVAEALLVLGIETSCDETGVGLVRGHALLADAVASSVEEHARFGGVVPEVASRAHLEAMVPGR